MDISQHLVVGSSGTRSAPVCSQIVTMFGLPVLSPEYQLALRHSFPPYYWPGNHVGLESTSSTGGLVKGVKLTISKG